MTLSEISYVQREGKNKQITTKHVLTLRKELHLLRTGNREQRSLELAMVGEEDEEPLGSEMEGGNSQCLTS